MPYGYGYGYGRKGKKPPASEPPEPGEPPTMNFSVATNSQLLATLEEF
jgi:hypothetical protein